MTDKIMYLCNDKMKGKKIAVLGVTFKPNNDDMRDSPSLTIVPALVGAGAEVHVVDPQGRKEGEELLPSVTWQEDPYEAVKDAEAVVILTEWNEFRALDLQRMSDGMKDAKMADLRNIYDPEEAKAAGFEYISIGR
jgi:UDPglucose 6-dehydrogenase